MAPGSAHVWNWQIWKRNSCCNAASFVKHPCKVTRIQTREKTDLLQKNIVQSMCSMKSWGRQTLILNQIDNRFFPIVCGIYFCDFILKFFECLWFHLNAVQSHSSLLMVVQCQSYTLLHLGILDYARDFNPLLCQKRFLNCFFNSKFLNFKSYTLLHLGILEYAWDLNPLLCNVVKISFRSFFEIVFI